MDFPINRSLDPFARLPPELCAAVLSLLPDEDLITVSHVSSFLRSQCLDDSLYAAPVKPRLEALLRNATSFPGDISSYTPAKIRELVRKLPYTSGTSYFDNIDTIRNFFLRQHFLKKSWGSGRPPRVTKLHSHDGHRSPVDKLAIDPTFNQIISIDREGLVCFWDIETSATTKAFRLEPSSTAVWATQGGLMALKDDVLLVGIAVWRVYLLRQGSFV
jgi:WD40 repeat protein